MPKDFYVGEKLFSVSDIREVVFLSGNAFNNIRDKVDSSFIQVSFQRRKGSAHTSHDTNEYFAYITDSLSVSLIRKVYLVFNFLAS